MSGFASLLIQYLVNSSWQVPLIAAAAWIAAKMLRPMGPGAEHRVWVAALVLEPVMPVLSLAGWKWIAVSWPWHGHSLATAEGNVLVSMSTGTAFAALRLPAPMVTLLVTAYLMVTAYCVTRFVWHWIRLCALSRSVDAESDATWERWRVRFAEERVGLGSSSAVFAPVTMGIFRKRVLLPKGLIRRVTQSDLDTAITHELAHIRRNDFLKNLIYEIVSLPVNYHPGVWFTRQQVMETREMVCDAMAAEEAGDYTYAQSLLRLASLLLEGKPVRVPHAIGVFDANTLERRLMKLTETKKSIGRARKLMLGAGCMVLGLATAGSALALRIGVDQKDSTNGIPSSVPAKVMQKQLITKVTPVYPPAAKAARIQGKVILEAVIGTSGGVENLKVVSGPNELQQSAMDAVRQWVYKPYLVNGSPVEVTTQITVTYTLKK